MVMTFGCLSNGKYSKYIKYNGSNFSIPGMPKDYNLDQTFDYVVKTFKWDKNEIVIKKFFRCKRKRMSMVYKRYFVKKI
jgi:hypothetical protein